MRCVVKDLVWRQPRVRVIRVWEMTLLWFSNMAASAFWGAESRSTAGWWQFTDGSWGFPNCGCWPPVDGWRFVSRRQLGGYGTPLHVRHGGRSSCSEATAPGMPMDGWSLTTTHPTNRSCTVDSIMTVLVSA